MIHPLAWIQSMTERPLECSQCKKTIKITYKEIVGDTLTQTVMCADCPILQQKLHGDFSPLEKREGELCCGFCGTSLGSVRIGEPVGCPECYIVFADFLIKELIAADAIPPSLKKKLSAKKAPVIHIGKFPGRTQEITLSSQLASLNEALNEALQRENYEQAAWLRDQIKALMEKQQ